MPNRILREGILTSERVEKLNWAEEVFYRRLMSVVDDFGRYYARPALLLAACYPLLLKKVSDSDIEKWLSACENAALVRVYPAPDGKRYLQLLDFKQQVRATASKFPQPPDSCEADATQELGTSTAPAHLDVSVSEVVSEDDKSRKRLSPPDGVSDVVWTDFLKLRKAKRAPMTDTALQGIQREADKIGWTLQKALETCCQRGWQGFEAKWVMDKADVARQTVPGAVEPDPALLKIKTDAAKAVPPSLETLAKLAELRKPKLTQGVH
jgi:hypothetical protein